ncbi:MAG TPA: MerR family transcriptional regulator, partial [Solirubrobacterales bacterium]|nr:MerR family transcriptional regulator [Solirubrobacterales bacterium]
MDERISLGEAARRSGVPQSTLKRWAEEKIIPVRKGRWTPAAAAQARVVARMRDRGYSLEDLKEAGREGRLAFAFAEDLFTEEEGELTVESIARDTGMEPELIERILT